MMFGSSPTTCRTPPTLSAMTKPICLLRVKVGGRFHSPKKSRDVGLLRVLGVLTECHVLLRFFMLVVFDSVLF